MYMYDVLIIGAGITGSLLARELTRFNLKIAVIDKENDVGNVTTNANSAIIHSGYDPVPGTLKAKLNVLGNAKYDALCDELDVPFGRIGSLTVALYDEQLPLLKELADRSKENGVEVKLLSPEEVKEMEPNISPEIKGALFAPTAGIIDPFNLAVHAMENAIDNGATLYLDEEVIGITNNNDFYTIKTNKRSFESKMVINAAGLNSDKIAAMVEDIDWKMIPRKGEYFILDHYAPGLVNHVIFPLPSEKGKGILVSLTTSGNYIVGPSSEPVDDVNDFSTDALTLANVRNQALSMVPSIPFFHGIRVFSGIRPTTTRHDFIIETAKDQPFFINVAGIESPGLASSPAISDYVIYNFVSKVFDLEKNPNFNPRVRRYIRLKTLSLQERNELIKKNPDYGHIVCFCEQVSLGEIKDTFLRSVPPTTVKGIKRRTRAGFGRCQGGFCSPTVTLEIAKYFNISPAEIKWDKDDSEILLSKVKDI